MLVLMIVRALHGASGTYCELIIQLNQVKRITLVCHFQTDPLPDSYAGLALVAIPLNDSGGEGGNLPSLANALRFELHGVALVA